MATILQTQTPPRVRSSVRAPLVERLPAALFASLIVLYGAAILSLRYFPTLDGPMLMYYADAFRSLLAGRPAFHSYFQLQHAVGAHMFYFYFVTVFSPFLDLLTIEKLFVAAYLAWLAYSFYYLAESIAPGRGFPVALFVFPFALNANVYWAFYDFSMSAATALFVCGWWLRNFDRLKPIRSVAGALMVFGLIVMHVIGAAMVLLFAGIHLSLYGLMHLREASGSARERVWAVYRKTLRPALHLAGGAAMLYLFKPPSVGKAQTDPFLQEPRARIYQLATMRPFSPFESRFFRGMLGIVLLTALVMLGVALWRRRRALPLRAEWSAALTGCAAMAAFVVVPFWIAGGAYFPHRFAIFGAFFLLAPAALLRLPARARLLLTLGAFAVSLAALAFQVRIDRTLDSRYGAVLDLPPLPNAALGALVVGDEWSDAALGFNVQLWPGMHYIRRSGAALLNSPWLDVPGNWLLVRKPQPCQFLNPILMRSCLAQAANQGQAPPLDLLIGTRGRRFVGPRPPGIAEDLARRYGLTRVLWSSPYLAIYARPVSAPASAAAPAR